MRHRELRGKEHPTPVLSACNMEKNQKLNTEVQIPTPLSCGVSSKALKQGQLGQFMAVFSILNTVRAVQALLDQQQSPSITDRNVLRKQERCCKQSPMLF